MVPFYVYLLQYSLIIILIFPVNLYFKIQFQKLSVIPAVGFALSCILPRQRGNDRRSRLLCLWLGLQSHQFDCSSFSEKILKGLWVITSFLYTTGAFNHQEFLKQSHPNIITCIYNPSHNPLSDFVENFSKSLAKVGTC